MKIGIISDLHANLEALRALDESFDELWVLGDLVNYGPDPVAVLDFARKHATAVVRGNHDHSIGCDEDPQCSPRFRAMAAATQRYSASMLGKRDCAYLRNLPLQDRREAVGARFLLCHATPSNPLYEYCLPDSPRWEKEAAAADADIVLVGHTHLPFMRRFGNVIVANPGSLGQSKAGQPRACYAVWRDGALELKSIPYAVDETVRKLGAMGLAKEIRRDLAHVLLTGTVPPP
ncbi:MAG: metallophosphoesterase family protein [Candidatus Binataceae bacterium]